MATCAISITFNVDIDDSVQSVDYFDVAEKLADQIGNFVVVEGELANEFSVIDVEVLDDSDDEADEDADYQDDDE